MDTGIVGRFGAVVADLFCRQVLVSILGMADRFDWKACTQSEGEDKEDVQAFKAAFAPFDPSL